MSANTAVAITTGMVRDGENAVVASRATVRSTTSTQRMSIQRFVVLMLNLASFSDLRLGRARSDVAAYSGERRPPPIGGRFHLADRSPKRRMLTIRNDIVNNITQNGRP